MGRETTCTLLKCHCMDTVTQVSTWSQLHPQTTMFLSLSDSKPTGEGEDGDSDATLTLRSKVSAPMPQPQQQLQQQLLQVWKQPPQLQPLPTATVASPTDQTELLVELRLKKMNIHGKWD